MRYLWLGVTGGLLVALSLAAATPTAAHDGLGWFHRPKLSGPANYPPNQTRDTSVPPGHERIRVETMEPQVLSKTPIPAYNWGYFGASSRTTIIQQHPYYNDYRQWSFRPGQ